MVTETFTPKGGIAQKNIESMRGGFTMRIPDGKGRYDTFTENEITPEILNEAREKEYITEARFAEIAFVLLEKNKKQADDLKSHNALLENSRGIDTLTGIGNLHALNTDLNRLIKEIKFSSGPKAIMVVTLDINKFKIFNEKPHNHGVGDRALFDFASRLQDVIKERGDTCYRKGGDEFVIVMTIMQDDVDFEKLFTDLQERVNKDLYINADNMDQLQITSSMGYAVLKKGEEKTGEELLSEADKMERENKEEGKD